MSTKYYCVGFNFGGHNNQLERFLNDGIWESNHVSNIVSNVPVGARLAAKTTYVRKETGKAISVLEVHAIGTVTKNYYDQQRLDVTWDKDFKRFKLDGAGAYRAVISQVNSPENIKRIFLQTQHPPQEKLTAEKKEYLGPLNQILYGPPGTGKTYNTINKALEIIDPAFYEENYFDRKLLTKRFGELLIKDWDQPGGQIVFTTFHQSLSYEDFIEGIKPVPPNAETEQLTYRVEDGIFKKIAKEAGKKQARTIKIEGQQVELTEKLFEEFYYTFTSRLAPTEANESNYKLKTQEGYEFGLFKNSARSIYVKAGEKKANLSITCNELKRVIFDNKTPVYKSYEKIIIDKILEDKEYNTTDVNNKKKPYVLIIDEINRGNISQIFGELITLIEDDKREGNDENLAVTLPYSKDLFTVPSNLYIIGTMNTADRSVEALDTALRRRFVFAAKPPDPSLLSPAKMLWRFWWDQKDFDWHDQAFVAREKPLHALLGFPEKLDNNDSKDKYWGPMKEAGINEEQSSFLNDIIFTEVNLEKLLIHINKRIQKLLNKDYQIGHAYFIRCSSIDDLKNIFQHKILPLLQEYFFGDYGRIGLVIGEVFVGKAEVTGNVNLMTVAGYEAGDLNDIRLYEIQDVINWDDPTFVKNIKAIYGE